MQSFRKLRTRMTYFSFIVQSLFGLAALSGFDGVTIERLRIPLVARNGSGPVDLTCVYKFRETENGLVVKWYHNQRQIYLWMPPMEPEAQGIIAGLTSYSSDATSRPQSQSVIRLKEVKLNMSGEYICSVSTFVSQDVSQPKMMTVYVPEKYLDLKMTDLNETHVRISCSAFGAHPVPVLKILLASKVLENQLITEEYPTRARISSSIIINKPTRAVLIECEIQIPGTGYGNREILTFWPH